MFQDRYRLIDVVQKIHGKFFKKNKRVGCLSDLSLFKYISFIAFGVEFTFLKLRLVPERLGLILIEVPTIKNRLPLRGVVLRMDT